MRAQHGIAAPLILGAFTFLVAGAAVLSILTAPQVEEEQLQAAAKNDLAATSFVLTDVSTASAPFPSPALGGKSSVTQVARIEYQSPDRVLEYLTRPSQPPVTVLVVGSQRFYKSTGSVLWSRFPRVRETPITVGEAEAQVLRLPLEAAAGATSVSRDGSTYSFTPTHRTQLVERLFPQKPSSLSSIRFSATVSGEFVSSVLATATSGQFRLLIQLGYSSVGTAPAISVPPASQIEGVR
jgi:hypothetical protein